MNLLIIFIRYGYLDSRFIDRCYSKKIELKISGFHSELWARS